MRLPISAVPALAGALACSPLFSQTAVFSSSQEPVHLTLSQAVQMALTHNRHLALARLSVRDSEEQKRIAAAHQYPQLGNHSLVSYITEREGVVIPTGAFAQNGPAGLVPAQTVQVDQGANTTYGSFTELTQPLTQLFALHADVRAASADLRSARLQSTDARNGTALAVEQLYFSILIEQSRSEAAAAAQQAADLAQDESSRALEDGKLLPDAELAARVAALQKQQNALVSKLNRDDLQLRLDDAVGLPLGTAVELDGGATGIPVALPTRQQAIAQVLGANPTVLAARENVAKARAGLAIAHDAYIPELTGLARYNYQSGISFFPHNFGTFGGQVSYTLFDGGAREAKVRQAHIHLAEAETRQLDVENRIRIEVSADYDKNEELTQLVQVASQAVTARQESLRIQSKRLELHAELPSGVAAARAALAEAQSSLLTAKLQLLLASHDVKRLLGQTPG